MAGKTNTEAIRDLEQTVATITERLASVGRKSDEIEAAHSRTVESLARFATQVAVLEERLAALKQGLEESGRKRWMVTLAMIGCLLTLAANIVLSFLHK